MNNIKVNEKMTKKRKAREGKVRGGDWCTCVSASLTRGTRSTFMEWRGRQEPEGFHQSLGFGAW